MCFNYSVNKESEELEERFKAEFVDKESDKVTSSHRQSRGPSSSSPSEIQRIQKRSYVFSAAKFNKTVLVLYTL